MSANFVGNTGTGREKANIHTKLVKDHTASYKEITQGSNSHPVPFLSGKQGSKGKANTNARPTTSGPTSDKWGRQLMSPCSLTRELASTFPTKSFDETKQLKRGVVLCYWPLTLFFTYLWSYLWSLPISDLIFDLSLHHWLMAINLIINWWQQI